jgi:hypothetical protein
MSRLRAVKVCIPSLRVPVLRLRLPAFRRVSYFSLLLSPLLSLRPLPRKRSQHCSPVFYFGGLNRRQRLLQGSQLPLRLPQPRPLLRSLLLPWRVRQRNSQLSSPFLSLRNHLPSCRLMQLSVSHPLGSPSLLGEFSVLLPSLLASY